MLYLVRMDVNIPTDVPPAAADAAKSAEKALSQALQCDGRWRHLWRVVGQYANYSVFDVPLHGHSSHAPGPTPFLPRSIRKITTQFRFDADAESKERTSNVCRN